MRAQFVRGATATKLEGTSETPMRWTLRTVGRWPGPHRNSRQRRVHGESARESCDCDWEDSADPSVPLKMRRLRTDPTEEGRSPPPLSNDPGKGDDADARRSIRWRVAR
mmetsp:Transcript_44241/g.86845  ORF Transcript_44241/g.86845 Transcript_44241/m.86845 type:complete len:109 (+) Transcript_44241:354-680(+)